MSHDLSTSIPHKLTPNRTHVNVKSKYRYILAFISLFRVGKMYYSRRYLTAEDAAKAADLLIYKAQGHNADLNYPLAMDVRALVDQLTLEQVREEATRKQICLKPYGWGDRDLY
jgi:hypothetical protein